MIFARRQETVPPDFLSQQIRSARRFYRNLKPRHVRGLSVVCGGWEDCARDYAIDRDTFPFLSVEFVASGRGEVVLGGHRHVLEPGTVFTYGPGISQCITTSPEKPLGKYFVDFTGVRGERLLSACKLHPGTCVQLSVTTEVRQAFDTLVRLASGNSRSSERLGEIQLELLLLVIAQSTQPGSRSERRSLATFERCRAHIEANFLALTTVEEIASACHVDVSYLCRLFRHFQSETPFRYLQRLRMQWAAERLHASGRLVREVADELRIDPFQFSRTFKRVHGVSPSMFLGVRQ